MPRSVAVSAPTPPLLLLAALLWAGGLEGQETRRRFDPPFELPDGVELRERIAYDSVGGEPLVLDLFLPASGGAPSPALLFLPGLAGDRAMEQFWRQAARLASRGYAGVVIGYRQTEDGWARFPESLHDARAALGWIRENAPSLALDTARIGVVGASQGGWLAALLALHRGAEGAPAPERPPPVRAVALFNPLLDLTDIPHRPNDDPGTFPALALGATYPEDPALWAEASPIRHVGPDSPPFLFLHGTEDRSTPYRHSVRMAAALLEARVGAELFTAGGAGHGFFNGPPWYGPSVEALEDFFGRTLAEGGAAVPP